MVGGIFSWHTLGPLVTIEHRLNATAYLSIVADHVHPFMTTVYSSSDGNFQQDNAPCHKAQIISDWFLEHDNEFTLLKWPPHNNLVSEKKWLKKVKVKKISSIICANTTWFDMLLSKCSLSIQIVFWGCQYICLCFLWFVCRSAVDQANLKEQWSLCPLLALCFGLFVCFCRVPLSQGQASVAMVNLESKKLSSPYSSGPLQHLIGWLSCMGLWCGLSAGQ